MKKKDIVDKFVDRWAPIIIKKIYDKYKEGILYLFFGGLTFLISVITYAVFTEVCRINELIANIISWMIAVLFVGSLH